jgi:hypothetical protein
LITIAEVVSVSPYPFAGATRASNCDSMRRIRSGGTGAPPDAMPAKASGGTRSSSGESSSWRSTIGTSEVLVMRSLARSSTAVSMSHLYIVTSLVPVVVAMYRPVRPPMWKNGNTCSAAGCGASDGGGDWPAMARARAPRNSVFMMFVQWLRWVARAPLGAPVVPDVYMIVAWSSGSIGTSGSAAVRSSSPRIRSQAVTWGGASSRRRLTIVAAMSRSSKCGASRAQRSSSRISTRVPESRIA